MPEKVCLSVVDVNDDVKDSTLSKAPDVPRRVRLPPSTQKPNVRRVHTHDLRSDKQWVLL
jgi:hypothetical protein